MSRYSHLVSISVLLCLYMDIMSRYRKSYIQMLVAASIKNGARMTLDEIREWIKFVIILVGGMIALRTYIVSQRQRRLENSLKLIDILFSNLEETDLAEWKRIFMNSSEPSGAKNGYFFSRDKQEIPFVSLFSEGPDDNGSVSRIVQQIDLIAYEALRGTIDVRLVYTRIGQLINTTHNWFGGGHSLIYEHYPNFHKFYRKYNKKFKGWPTKVYSYCE